MMQVLHNTPGPGYIAWQDVNIQYKGVTYAIPNGNTNKKFVMWLYSDPGGFYGSDTFPALGPDDLLVFLNKNGVYSIVPKTQIVDGSLIVSDSVTTDALAANSVTTEKIAAGAISADKIAANAIGAEAIIAGAIGADEIAAGAIATNHLAALVVTADKIATNAISADKIAANAIGAEKIAAGAITAEKLSVGVAQGMTGPINADNRPISSTSNQITLDATGLKMRRTGETVDRMHLDARRLGFRDPTTNKPTAGIGYVRDLAQELDPTADPANLIQHGLFIAQGEIRATQSVLSGSLTEGGTGQTHLANGSVTLPKLATTLSVTIPERFIGTKTARIDGTTIPLQNPGFETGNLSGWSGTGTVSTSYKIDGNYGLGGTVNVYQDVAAQQGRILRFSAKGRGHNAAGSITVKIQWLTAAKALISEVTTTNATSDSVIQLYYVSGVAPANSAYARVAVVATTSRVDSAVLEESATSASKTILQHTIPGADACEQISLELTTEMGLAWIVEINGTTELSAYGFSVSTTIDVRGYSGALTIVARTTSTTYTGWFKAALAQNQRLPIRAASPLYSVTTCGGACQTACQASCQVTCEFGCQSACESSCQTACQTSCQDSCQSTCQDVCQSTCQSTCEATSQGGGCWVEGTLVTVYDSEAQAMREIAVESLQPGMQMPWYNIAQDTIELTECMSNERTWTHTIYVAEVEGGHQLEMTGEQPMDVLRERDGELVWLKLPARYIRAGDKLVRPFEGTLHEVVQLAKTIRAQTWVRNPKTAAGRYIVQGFADAEKILT